MRVEQELRKGATIFLLTARSLLGTKRGVATIGLGLVPLALAASLAVARVETFDITLFQVLLVPLFLQVVLIFVTIVQASALLRDEIEDDTMPYLLTRPISKPAIAGYKYAGYLVSTLLVLVPSVASAYVVTQGYAGDPLGSDLDVLSAFLLATVLGTSAYGAFFLLLSVLTRKPLAAGLLFGFLWESIVGSIPGDVPKLSIIHYLRSILKDLVAVGPLAGYRTDLSAFGASLVLIGFSVGALVLAMFLFHEMEFAHKA